MQFMLILKIYHFVKEVFLGLIMITYVNYIEEIT